ncbi:hypothetical protein [Mesorhizobium sp. M0130]|uniref:SLOG cluster 4 domain-containing protein n=1 Tax=Mesorhizobium sp. M0130 TaxID=2956887 RepID=UPI003335DE99
MKRLKMVAVVGSAGLGDRGDKRRALLAGRIVAELGCNLLTGGGPGSMYLSAREFCITPGRKGQSIGILPGTVEGWAGAELGKLSKLTFDSKEGYPNPWVEIPIFTHLPGKEPKSPCSRNILNIASADVVVVLAGGKGTQAEFELAYAIDKKSIVYMGHNKLVGIYTCSEIKRFGICVQRRKNFATISCGC